MSLAVREFDVVRVADHERDSTLDQVAVELPLEVRLNGQPFSVIMRTPGDDRHLALGFLLSESVVSSRDEIDRVDVDEAENTVDVTLIAARADAVADALGQRRQVTMNSSCGMCGRRTLESLSLNLPPFAVRWQVSEDTVLRLPETLGAAQSVFSRTGGLHAAGLFDITGQLLASAEDVGRHNAVDKLLGRMMFEGRLPLQDSLLFVSGRSSFELVQKAWLGGIPLLAAVSAPSSLAVDLAREAGMTLLGFVRKGRFNVYSQAERVGK